MTPEEETRANVAVMTIQSAWEHMANRAMDAECRAVAAEARVKELEKQLAEKTAVSE